MEFIKKTVLQAVITGTTAITCTYRDPETGILYTGCTGCCRIIIPNTGATYYFCIGLVQEAYDWGFFDASEVPIVYGYGYGYEEELVYGIGESLVMNNKYI